MRTTCRDHDIHPFVAACYERRATLCRGESSTSSDTLRLVDHAFTLIYLGSAPIVCPCVSIR